MSLDGRHRISHRWSCTDRNNIIVGPNRVTCAACGRYAPRTDVPAGTCRDCGRPCRPDMTVCKTCKAAELDVPAPAPVTIPKAKALRGVPVCRGCYQPATVRVKPGKGFICPRCTSGRAA